MDNNQLNQNNNSGAEFTPRTSPNVQPVNPAPVLAQQQSVPVQQSTQQPYVSHQPAAPFIEQHNPADSPSPGGGKNKLWMIIGIVIALLVIAGALTYFFVLGGDDDSSNLNSNSESSQSGEIGYIEGTHFKELLENEVGSVETNEAAANSYYLSRTTYEPDILDINVEELTPRNSPADALKERCSYDSEPTVCENESEIIFENERGVIYELPIGDWVQVDLDLASATFRRYQSILTPGCRQTHGSETYLEYCEFTSPKAPIENIICTEAQKFVDNSDRHDTVEDLGEGAGFFVGECNPVEIYELEDPRYNQNYRKSSGEVRSSALYFQEQYLYELVQSNGEKQWFIVSKDLQSDYWTSSTSGWTYGCDYENEDFIDFNYQGNVWNQTPYIIEQYCKTV